MTIPVQQAPVFGGIASGYIAAVAAVLGVGAAGLGLFELAGALALGGIVAYSALRGLVVESSPVGITKGFVLNGRFLGRSTVLPWGTITTVHTDWRYPGDDTGLTTTVSDADGHTIQFTTAMGLRAYWSCLAMVAANTSPTGHSGLTAAVLSGDRPGGRQVMSVAGTAAALALVLVAFVGVHYIWAQGRSSLSRALEHNGWPGSAAGTVRPSPAAPAAPVR